MLRAPDRSVLWVRRGTVVMVAVALVLIAVDDASSIDWSTELALGVGRIIALILLFGALCEAILRLPWRGAKAFLLAGVVIPLLGGVASIALPEGVIHFGGLLGFYERTTLYGWSTAVPPGRGLRLISSLVVPLVGALALIVAVSFDARWPRVLPLVTVAVGLTLAARELVLTNFQAEWCADSWPPFVDEREFPSCTGLNEPLVVPLELLGPGDPRR